jgi:IS30 family transposase
MKSLEQIFADPSRGLSRGSFLSSAKLAGYTTKDALAHYERESSAQVHKTSRQPFHSIVNPKDSWQMDLMFLEDYKDLPANRGKKGILCCIEGTSRYAWCRPFAKKDAKTIAGLLGEFIDEHSISSITSDDGPEFAGVVKDLFERNNIKHYKSARMNITAKVERFNRTLRNKLSRWFELSKSHSWVAVLPDIIVNYNI